MAEVNKHTFVSAKADGADATLVRPSNWNAEHQAGTTLTNASGGGLVANDVVVLTSAANESVDDTTTIGDTRQVFVAQATIADTASGRFKNRGQITVAVQGAVNRGDGLRTSATSKKAEAVLPSGRQGLGAGIFAIAITSFAGPGAGTVEAIAFGFTIPTFGFKGPDVASVAALAPDNSGVYFHVTGTTTITSIAARTGNPLLILEFDASLSIQHSIGTIDLAGGANYVSTAGSILGLVHEGSGAYREVFRSGFSFDPTTKLQYYDDFLLTTDLDESGGARAYDSTGLDLTNHVFTNNLKIRMKASDQQTGAAAGTRFIGLSGAAGVFTSAPSEGIYFRHALNANYIAVCRSGGVESTLDTGVAAVTGGSYIKLELVSNGGSIVTVIVNGLVKGTITSNIPSTLLKAAAGSSAGAGKLDYFFVEQNRA